MSSDHILIIYPEVHNTKIAVYRNVEPLFLKTISHTKEELAQFEEVADQKDFRIKFIKEELENNNYPLESIEIFMGRSGLVKPVSQGVYRINDTMVSDLVDGIVGKHATNLGALIAYEFAQKTGKEAYIANPVVVDELSDVARITGHPLFER
ncbi:MAG: butyrate kinase, partial [Bacteroidetes bacterium]